MYRLVRAASVHLRAAWTGLPLVPHDEAMCLRARQQYGTFPPGLYKWPALLRLLDEAEPDYRD